MGFGTTRLVVMALGLLAFDAALCLSGSPALALPARAYVASQSDGTLRVIEGKTGVGSPIKVGSGTNTNVTDVATSPDGRLVYVANSEENRVYVVDAVNAFTQEPVPVDSKDLQKPTFLAATDFGVYVANEGNHTVSLIAKDTKKVEMTSAHLVESGGFQTIVVTPEQPNCCVYVAYPDGGKSKLFVLDYDLNRRSPAFPDVPPDVDLPTGPRALGRNPKAPVIYVTLGTGGLFIWNWAQRVPFSFDKEFVGGAAQHVDATGDRLLLTTRDINSAANTDALRLFQLNGDGTPIGCLYSWDVGHLEAKNPDGVAVGGDGALAYVIVHATDRQHPSHVSWIDLRQEPDAQQCAVTTASASIAIEGSRLAAEGHFTAPPVLEGSCGNDTLDPGEDCDQGAANGTAASCCSASCTLLTSATVCRPSAGVCDVAETCTGSGPACPLDGLKSSGTPCADDGNMCTSDTCDGSSKACQHELQGGCVPCSDGLSDCPDGGACSVTSCVAGKCQYQLREAGSICRPAVGPCDVAEVCPGSGPNCPNDGQQPADTQCASDGDECTRDVCDGTSVSCTHPSSGDCECGDGDPDPGEECDAGTANGTAGSCCTNECRLRAASEQCRPAVGECDVAEFCTGTTAVCPADAKMGLGSACTGDGNPCTLDQCDGAAVTCQHPAGNAGTVCRAAAGVCDIAETCTGTSAACPGDAFAPSAQECRAAAGACDAAEQCTGSSPQCPADVTRPDGTTCDDGDACTEKDECAAGACSGRPKVCEDGNACTVDGCAPSTGACIHTPVTDGTSCDDGDLCTDPDACSQGSCVGQRVCGPDVPEGSEEPVHKRGIVKLPCIGQPGDTCSAELFAAGGETSADAGVALGSLEGQAFGDELTNPVLISKRVKAKRLKRTGRVVLKIKLTKTGRSMLAAAGGRLPALAETTVTPRGQPARLSHILLFLRARSAGR